jgi:tetratricopeptide (TPR) repeat protein
MIDVLIKQLKDFGEKKAAIVLMDALGRHSESLQQFDMLGKAAFEIKAYDSALTFARKALDLAVSGSQRYDAEINLINCLAHAYHPEEAVERIEKLEKSFPDDWDRDLKKAYCLFFIDRREEAESLLRKHLLNPKLSDKEKNDINFNLGTYELCKDNLKEGLYRFLHYGRKMDLWKKPQLPFKFWSGVKEENISGKTLIIRAEAGIGDEFINVRFVQHLKELSINPIWYTDRKDLALLFSNRGIQTATSLDQIKRSNDLYWCHSMDLPVLLDLSQKDLWKGKYISSIKDSYSKGEKLKIGIRWQGNPDYDNDLHRSIPLEQMYKSLERFDVELYSLQRDTGAEEADAYPRIKKLNLDTWEDTLQSIQSLDLVITSCTSVAHASAGMGKETFVFTPLSAYYTWCHTTEKSPWYPESVTLFRQKRPRFWDEPLKELEDKLDELLRHKS